MVGHIKMCAKLVRDMVGYVKCQYLVRDMVGHIKMCVKLVRDMVAYVKMSVFGAQYGGAHKNVCKTGARYGGIRKNVSIWCAI